MFDMNAPTGVKLESNALSVAIDPLGAQLVVLRDRVGNDLLWNGDPAWWNGRAPVLFPIVGALRDGSYRWQGRRYALPRHGFARGKPFAVDAASRTQARFILRADAETRLVYPFDFQLSVDFSLWGSELSIVAAVHNPGRESVPASLGFHPAFRWPLVGGETRSASVEFECDEPAEARRLDQSGLLRPRGVASGVHGRVLTLDDALFADDVLIFDRLISRRVLYRSGERSIDVGFPDATFLGLWSKPGAPFVCIEPWRGVADPVGADGELSTKPGIFTVAPGATERLTMTLRVG